MPESFSRTQAVALKEVLSSIIYVSGFVSMELVKRRQICKLDFMLISYVRMQENDQCTKLINPLI